MDDQHPLKQRKPDISYPCIWEYKVIGTDKGKLEAVLYAACAPAVPNVSLANVSSKGTYFSLNATVEVQDEQMRLAIFRYLQNSSAVNVLI